MYVLNSQDRLLWSSSPTKILKTSTDGSQTLIGCMGLHGASCLSCPPLSSHFCASWQPRVSCLLLLDCDLSINMIRLVLVRYIWSAAAGLSTVMYLRSWLISLNWYDIKDFPQIKFYRTNNRTFGLPKNYHERFADLIIQTSRWDDDHRWVTFKNCAKRVVMLKWKRNPNIIQRRKK